MTQGQVVKWGVVLNGDGTGTSLEPEKIKAAFKDGRPIWAHVDGRNVGVNAWLDAVLADVPDLSREALLQIDTRPRVEEIGGGLLINLRVANLNEGDDAHDMIALRLWVDNNRIISVERRHIKAFRDVLDKINNGKGPKSAGELLTLLCQRVIDRLEPVVARLDDDMDDAEEMVLDNSNSELSKKITEIRQKVIGFRKFLAPQREALTHLHGNDVILFNDRQKLSLKETYNHLIRLIEDLDAIRERAHVVKDEVQNSMSEILNKRLFLFGIVTIVFLPLSFLTGLLGINVGGIPGATNEGAFLIVVGITLLILVGQLLYLKIKNWF